MEKRETLVRNGLSKKAATGRILQKKLFLKMLQYLQENTCARFSFI